MAAYQGVKKSLQVSPPLGVCTRTPAVYYVVNSLMAIENCYLFANDCLLVTSSENPAISTELMEKSIHEAAEW